MIIWKDISTAPKDGTFIIVWPPTFHNVTSCAWWNSQKLAVSPRPYWKRLDSYSVKHDRDNPPTHWAPVIKGPHDD